MKTLTTIFFNILIIALLLLFVEIFFGGWLDKNNLGAYFREHRMKKVDYSIKYKNEILNYTYKRNYHGFRGEAIKPKNIKAVFIGGSTADERWKPAKLSIVELLNKKLQADKIDLKIINAGIEGQSTTGYIANFKFWFSKLEDFKPDYFIFYTGINELNKQDFNVFDYSDGQAKLIDKNKKNVFFDNLKSKSFFYDSLRKIKHKYYTRDVAKTIFMDIDNQILKIKPPAKYGLKNYKYITFNESLKSIQTDTVLSNTFFSRSNIDDPTVGFDWEYILIEDKKVKNAWCMPGGKIAVYTGILDITKNKNGLAAVMGHEIAHAVAKHSVERASRGVLLNTGTQLIDIFSGGKLSQVNRVTGMNTVGLLSQIGIMNPFSRTQESEADYLGMIFASLSGYDIRETKKLWERMKASKKGKEISEFMSTHPSSDTRIKNLNEWENEVILDYPPITLS